ncbi:DNA primase [Bdellovibrio sp. HCB337]|uniref:DNA primase n=1 Tax=Bdellovibrio sp. HCB337 TaxID=3394358 RepID=UPI0039A451D0
MKFSPEFIEKVRDANNVVDIISQYTQLKPTGSGLMGRCPFPDHQEKTPSFSVSETKQVYHCFGCHKKGNIFTFLQNYQGMSFPEAIEYLAGRANIAMPEKSSDSSNEQFDRQKERKKLLARVNQLANYYFGEQLKRVPNDHPVKKYIAKRGLSQEVLDAFQVGYSTPEWDGLVKYLESKKVPMDLVEEARLAKARSGGKTGHFDIFRDRLMFPILNPMGEAVAFGGRIIEQGEPKYLNSPETPVFIKGRILYGLAQTARYIRTEDQAIIVEGYMDLVSLYQAGIRNAAATMGTALTPDHGKLLKRMTKNVVVLFDGDSAGQEAAERSLPILLSADVHPKGLTLPDGMDPDDFVKAKGADALKDLMAKAPDLFVLILQRWMEDYRGEASQKVKLCDQLKPVLEVIPDSRLQDLYLQEAARRMSVPSTWLKEALFKQNGKLAQEAQNIRRDVVNAQKPAAPAPVEPKTVPNSPRFILKGAPKPEILLMSLALKSRANFDVYLQENITENISHAATLEILQKAADVYRQDPNKFDKLTSLLVSFVDHPELLFMTENAGESFDEESERKLLRDVFKKVRDNSLREQAKKLARDIKAEPSAEKLEQIMNIQRNRHSLNKN